MTDREIMQMALDALSMAVEPKKGKVYAFDFQPIDCAAMHLKAIEALRAALAQPEQEPTRSQKMRDAGITRRPKGWDKEQELEGINEVILNSIRDSSEVVAPPQREWQKLNAADMRELGISSIRLEMAKAIEAKLKEKNAC